MREIFSFPGSIKFKIDMLLRTAIRETFPFRTKRFENSNQYWKDRYKWAGNSGKGSRGKIAAEKAAFVNWFCRTHNIDTVVEFGSGDGVCASMIDVKKYIGFDISDAAIDLAKERCSNPDTYKFFNYDNLSFDEINSIVSHNKLSENIVSISMDVIFHLVEDNIFYNYIDNLCKIPSKYIIVLSSDSDGPSGGGHLRDRAYSQLLLDKYGLKLLHTQSLHRFGETDRWYFKIFSR